ncbi:MAG TPA: hypothetical protein PK961_14965 [bacterium]|nr:hypothetical protein [bacterium]
MKKMLAIIVCAVLLGALAVLSGCGVKSDTLESLILAAQAIENRNYNDFNRYVNVERLANQIVDLMFDEMESRSYARAKKLLRFGEKFSKPYLVEETKKQIEKRIEDGTLAKQIPGLRELPSSSALIKLFTYFGVAESDGKHYEIIEVKRTRDDEEELKIKVRTSADDDWLLLHLRSRKFGDHYRLRDVVNLREVAMDLWQDWQD